MSNKLIVAALIGVSLWSCTKEETVEPIDNGLEVPSSYTFERNGSSSVNYTGQADRVSMLDEMVAYVKTANSLGTSLDLLKVQDMYTNSNNAFSKTYTKQLKDKTNPNWISFYDSLFVEMVDASFETTNAAPGKPGVLNEEYPSPGTASSSGRLVNENGLEYKELLEKGIMGHVFYYQATEVYLTKERMNDSWLGNEAVSDGKNYTDMEHYFDEGFGYFGVSPEFTEPKFWGKYANARNNDADAYAMANINSEMFEAFRTGRAAIVAKDLDARNTAIKTILNKWEAIAANTGANYLDEALADIAEENIYAKAHHLSEGIGFLLALQNRGSISNGKYGRISDLNTINEVLAIIGLNTNLYTVTAPEIELAISKLKAAFPGGEVN